MSERLLERRRFLQAASALGLGAELGPMTALRSMSPLAAAEATVSPEIVKFRPEIEPAVRLLEETPREKALEVVIERLKNGLSYRELMAGLFLAGIRNIKPRPVGFKFHAVMVINSAHLLGQTAAVSERLLPLLWAVDTFKSSQAQDVREGDWVLGPVNESRLPKPRAAREAFVQAMKKWDAEAADAAIAALCRTSGSAATMEPLWRFAVRDQRNIGHKAIFAAQSWRTLQTIGWEHAEPVLRSLVFGMLDLQGDDRPKPVGPYDANLENAAKIREDWQFGRADAAATQSLLQVVREATPEAASAEAVKLLNQGIDPGSLWDTAILSSCELLMQSPGILALHATTTMNALHFIYSASGDDTTRRLALLQAIGWQPLYRGRAKPADSTRIDTMAPAADLLKSRGNEAIAEIFDSINQSRQSAGQKTLAYLAGGGSPDLIFDAARRMIFHKGRDSHDYKYGAAVWEEVMHATDPRWKAPMIAAAMFNLPGAKTPDSPLMIRARESLASVSS